MPTTERVELVKKKEVIAAALDLDDEVFVVYIASIINLKPIMYLTHQTQMVFMKVNKALTAIPSKYADFADVFSLDLAVEFFIYIGINNHTIQLINGK